jgi:UDP-GlcNAc:undecaprenyl-phosphate GlcNAc-1-phosphate transferase
MMLLAAGLLIGIPGALVALAIGRRLNAMDSAGVQGQVKAALRRVPNTGGIGVFWAIALPLLGVLGAARMVDASSLPRVLTELGPHLEGIRSHGGHALVLLGMAGVLHVMGLIDDRRALRAMPKLLVMLVAAAVVVVGTDSRLLTLLDGHVGGTWLSIVLSVLWIAVVTNSFNFLDNMDGLSGGCGVICAAFFMLAALVQPQPQWFVAGMLALVIGSLAGFLTLNYPRKPSGGATMFMGDGGSLVVGFLLAVLSIRITYVDAGPSGSLAAALTPVVILAIPLYDFCSVTLLRLRQGKSPFVGDLQHFSHRLVKRGLSRRGAVMVIHACTMATAIGGVALGSLQAWQAALVGVQTLLIVGVLAMYEWSHDRQAARNGEDA